MLRICPYCNSKLAKDDKEISPGTFTEVETCTICSKRESPLTERKKLPDLFKRKAFNISGSIAIRFPKEIAEALQIENGTNLRIEVTDDKAIVISKIA